MIIRSEVAELERQVRELQDMLGLVLYTVGEPVLVTRELVASGLPDGAAIAISEDNQREAFVFKVEINE